MNDEEIEWAYRIRQALNQNMEQISPEVSARLAAARHRALAARRLVPRPLWVRLWQRMTAVETGKSAFWTGLAVAVPVAALVVGLVSIFHYEQQQRQDDIAEVDMAVLSDALPASAYLDHGFNAYMDSREKRSGGG